MNELTQDDTVTEDEDEVPEEPCPDCEDTGITWADAFSHSSGHYTKDVPCSCLAAERLEARWEAEMDRLIDEARGK